jgi:hypothetical protein
VPDAVAGAMQLDTGMFLVVIPEAAPEVDVSAMANFLLQTLAAELPVTEVYENVTFLGQPAVRYLVVGAIDGVFFRFGNTVVSHRGHLYQVLGVGMREMTSSSVATFAPLWDAFSFLPGDTVPGRSGNRAVPDTTGVGWRTRGGVFESAAYGLAVEPSLPGWRISVGVELETMNPDAEVGLFAQNPEMYLVLIPERVVGEDPTRFAADLRRMFGQSLFVAAPEREIPVRVGETPVTLGLYRAYEAGQPLDFVHGVFFHGEHAVQVVAWWVGGLRDTVLGQLQPALSQVRLLDERSRALLATELAAAPDSQNTVGPDFALRGGLYRDYAYDLTWQKPAGFWRILTGQMARAINPDARLYIEEPAQGLAGVLIGERLSGLDNARYHQLVLTQMAPAGHPALSGAPTPRRVAGVDLLTSWVDLDVGGVALRYLVTTGVVADRLVQLLVWGLPGNVRASEVAVWQAVDGLALHVADLQGVTNVPGLFRDERLGFELRAPRPGWTIVDMTPPHLAPVATIVQSSPDDRHGVLVFAMCATAEGQDQTWFEQVAHDTVLARFEQDLGVTTGLAQEATVAGLPARRVTGYMPGGAGRVELYTMQRDRTFLALVAFDQDGFGPPLDELVRSLLLLE